MIGSLFCGLGKAFGGCELVPDLDEYIAYIRKQVGAINLQETTLVTVKTELKAIGIVPMFTTAPDFKVFYPDEVSLKKMIPYLTFSGEYYIANLDIDCDDYAMWAAAFSRLIFKCNGIYQAWGNMDLGYHAFNISKIGEKYLLWEPNAAFGYAGEPFEIGAHNYLPDKFK